MSFATALVTGASGFLGRSLVKHLSSRGCRVTALLRNDDAPSTSADRVVADIRDKVSLRMALSGYRFDAVFHLAAAGVAPRDRQAAVMFDTNAAATGNLVEAAARAGARVLVYAGSCSEYEAAEGTKLISEDHMLTRSNLYGASKAAGGLWGSALARELGVTFCWLRLFGIYGPGEAADRLIPYLAAHLAQDKPVDLTPGAQVRDMTYVDDAVEALVLAGEQALCGHDGPFNVCSGSGRSVHDIACMVAEALQKPRALLRFGARPYRPDEPPWLVGDPSRFTRITGYTPRIELDRGIGLALAARS